MQGLKSRLGQRYDKLPFRYRLSARVTLVLVLVFVIGLVLSGGALYQELRYYSEQWISSNSLLLLHTMNAVRSYTSTQVNPLLTPLMNAQGKFIPQSVPAFSARSVFGNLRNDTPYQGFYYKEAADNPTAPQDRADPWETQLLNYLRSNPQTKETSGFRILNGQPVFYDARPLTVSSQACLACHTTPQAAPASLVDQYGPINGFGWKLNDTIAAQIVYVPATDVYNLGRRTWASVMAVLFACLFLAALAVNVVMRRSVIRPIMNMADLARRISADEVDEKAPDILNAVAVRRDELGQMALVFQRMAHEVYAREQSLKQQVQELRIEIDEVKKARQVAELTESETFQDLRARALKMRQRHQDPDASGTPQEDKKPPESNQ